MSLFKLKPMNENVYDSYVATIIKDSHGQAILKVPRDVAQDIPIPAIVANNVKQEALSVDLLGKNNFQAVIDSAKGVRDLSYLDSVKKRLDFSDIEVDNKLGSTIAAAVRDWKSTVDFAHTTQLLSSSLNASSAWNGETGRTQFNRAAELLLAPKATASSRRDQQAAATATPGASSPGASPARAAGLGASNLAATQVARALNFGATAAPP
jgi:hypothetical protein